MLGNTSLWKHVSYSKSISWFLYDASFYGTMPLHLQVIFTLSKLYVKYVHVSIFLSNLPHFLLFLDNCPREKLPPNPKTNPNPNPNPNLNPNRSNFPRGQLPSFFRFLVFNLYDFIIFDFVITFPMKFAHTVHTQSKYIQDQVVYYFRK